MLKKIRVSFLLIILIGLCLNGCAAKQADSIAKKEAKIQPVKVASLYGENLKSVEKTVWEQDENIFDWIKSCGKGYVYSIKFENSDVVYQVSEDAPEGKALLELRRDLTETEQGYHAEKETVLDLTADEQGMYYFLILYTETEFAYQTEETEDFYEERDTLKLWQTGLD